MSLIEVNAAVMAIVGKPGPYDTDALCTLIDRVPKAALPSRLIVEDTEDGSTQATFDREPAGGPIGAGAWQVSHIHAPHPGSEFVTGNVVLTPKHDLARLQGLTHYIPYRLHPGADMPVLQFGILESIRMLRVNLLVTKLLFAKKAGEREPDRDCTPIRIG